MNTPHQERLAGPPSIADGTDRFRRSWITWVVRSVILAAAALFSHRASQYAPPDIFKDSRDYLAQASQSTASGFFLGRGEGIRHPRPPGYPLLLKVLGNNPSRIRVFQRALHLSCWLYLACALQAFCQNRVAGWLCFLSGMAMSCSLNLSTVQSHVLTESCVFSLTALAAAMAIHLHRSPTTLRLGGFCAILVALAVIRDAHSWMALYLGLAMILLFAVRAAMGIGRECMAKQLACLSVLVLASGLSIHASDRAGRWIFPLQNNFEARVLSSPTSVAWFVVHGMPSQTEPAAEKNDLKAWVRDHGKPLYARFLLQSSDFFLGDPIRDLPSLMGFCMVMGRPDDWQTLPNARWEWNPRTAWAFWFAGGLACGVLALAMRNAPRVAPIIALALSLSATMVLYLIAWHGDSIELGRHTSHAMLQVKIILLVLACQSLDAMAGVSRARSRACT